MSFSQYIRGIRRMRSRTEWADLIPSKEAIKWGTRIAGAIGIGSVALFGACQIHDTVTRERPGLEVHIGEDGYENTTNRAVEKQIGSIAENASDVFVSLYLGVGATGSAGLAATGVVLHSLSARREEATVEDIMQLAE